MRACVQKSPATGATVQDGYVFRPWSLPPPHGSTPTVGSFPAECRFRTRTNYTHGQSYQIHVQGSSTGYDTLWALTAQGLLYSNTPVGFDDTWSGWAYVGKPVPNFGADLPILSVFDVNDTPWVVNGDGSCDGNQNSHIYRWSPSSNSWIVEPGCVYNMTEHDDGSLWGAAYNSDHSTTLWKAANRNDVIWEPMGEIISADDGFVLSMIVEGTPGGGAMVYFTNGINLCTWNSLNDAVTTVVSGEIEVVARDQHSSAIYYALTASASQAQLWLY